MESDDTQTWVTSGYNKYRNDYLFAKNSGTDSSDYSVHLSDGPAPSKSRAALILTEVEEQLEVDETKYNCVKDRLEYIKMLCLSGGAIPSQDVGSDPGDDVALNEANWTLDTASNSPRDEENTIEDRVVSGETHYYDFYTEAKRTQDDRQEEESTERNSWSSARSYKVLPRQNTYAGAQGENSCDLGHPDYFSGVTSGGEKMFLNEGPSKSVVIGDHLQTLQEHGPDDTSTSHQHPYQLRLAEYSKDIHEELEKNSQDAEPAENDPETFYDEFIGSAREHEGKKEELYINLSASAESVNTNKKKKSRSEKHRKINSAINSTRKKYSSKQVDDTFYGSFKVKRKKLRLKVSNSRSTTATRDTCLPFENKRDTKKRRPRSQATMPASRSSQQRREIPTKIKNWSEVVEIYHNNELKSGSLSVVSSKHSRLQSRGRNTASANIHDQPKLSERNDQSRGNFNETEVRRFFKSQKKNHQTDGEEARRRPKSHRRTSQGSTDLRSGEPNRTKLIYKAHCPTIQSENKISEECNESHHCNPESFERPSAFYDPLAIRNYELPTVASKMKCVNRSYFNRFNFKNIPFVVGTSVTPSYNLGLNIQETLSLIKTRQIMPGGVTPLLISRVGKGMQPVSTLLKCADDKNDMSVEDSGIQVDVATSRICNAYPEQMAIGDRTATKPMQVGQLPLQTLRLGCIPTSQQLSENQETCGNNSQVPSAKKRNIQSICSSMKINSGQNAEDHLQLTQSTLLKQRQEELDNDDSRSTKWQSIPHNMSGIREVLVNFHNQFEAMNLEYEKLQKEAEKSNNESLKKEIEKLEKELSAKEEEINAVVNLYKEVIALKKQMRLLHERHSLVCVATESPGSPMYPQISSRAQTANPMFSLHRRNRPGSDNNRGPSTSTKLAGLLRQIKTYQKQLKSAS